MHLNVTLVTQESDIARMWPCSALRPVRPELLVVLNKAIGNIPTQKKKRVISEPESGFRRLATSLPRRSCSYSNC